jgi:hypothetical protein
MDTVFDADPVFDTEDIDREIIVLELARARARESWMSLWEQERRMSWVELAPLAMVDLIV